MKRCALKVLGLALLLNLSAVSWTWAQTQKKEATMKAAPAQDLNRGKSLYESNCASCHGMDGKGNGPVAVALKTPPSDLTQIARKNQGKFDEVHVIAYVDGEKTVSAHGTREMPVWGTRFRRSKGAMESSLTVYSLVKYLEFLQVK
jgi:mono/diheme cytochrome c family protein